MAAETNFDPAEVRKIADALMRVAIVYMTDPDTLAETESVGAWLSRQAKFAIAQRRLGEPPADILNNIFTCVQPGTEHFPTIDDAGCETECGGIFRKALESSKE